MTDDERGGSGPTPVDASLEQAWERFADPALLQSYQLARNALRALSRPSSQSITYSSYLNNAPPSLGVGRQAAEWRRREKRVRQIWSSISDDVLRKLKSGELAATGIIHGKRCPILAEVWANPRFVAGNRNRVTLAGMDYHLVRVGPPLREESPAVQESQKKSRPHLSISEANDLHRECVEEVRKAVEQSPEGVTLPSEQHKRHWMAKGMTRDGWQAARNEGIAQAVHSLGTGESKAWSKGGRPRRARKNLPDNHPPGG
ncbi:hypothetical protein [Teichococcus aestuarii]|uniref:hypothetical protein n=1 Tax=Teichococcus aestuarii TaxID=568898 RepID=UPI00360D8E8C